MSLRIYNDHDDPNPAHTDLSQFYVLADDITEVPFDTVRISLDTIASGGPGTTSPTILTPIADVVLTGTEKYHILVNSQDVAHTVTVADGQTAEIQNISNAAEDLVVISNGNANQTLTPGQSGIFRWNASTDDHEITLGTSVSVDAVMDDGSANPVQNQVVKDYIDTETVLVDNVQTTIGTSVHPPTTTAIKAYHDRRSYVRAGDYVLTQSAGDLATRISADDAAWNAAVAALNSQGYGTLWIDGEITLNAAKIFTKPISLRGLTTDAAIRVTHANAQLAWGSYWDAIVSGTGEAAFNLTATVAWQELITVSGSAWNQGDWLALWSSDEINGWKNLTHQYPLEVHQILRAQAGAAYHLGGSCADALITTAKARKIPMLNKPGGKRSDVVIEGIALRQSAGVVNVRLFDIRCLNGVLVEEMTWELNDTAGAPGDILFNYCSNVQFQGNQNHGTERYDTAGEGYWFEAAAVNGAICQHNFSRRCRHSFDTTSASQGGTGDSRWGTPRNLMIAHNVVHVEGNPTTIGNLIAMSTHGEGYGVTFEDNDIYISEHGGNVCGGITIRSRHAQIIKNRFWGGGLSKGVNVYAPDVTIADNEFHNCWQSIQFEDFYFKSFGSFDRPVIRSNEFHNCNGTNGTIWIEACNDGVLDSNIFYDCDSGGVHVVPSAFTFTVNTGTEVITATGHSFNNGDQVEVSSTTTLPAPLSANTVYFVRDIALNELKLSTTPGGTAIDLTTTGTGTHTITAANRVNGWCVTNNRFIRTPVCPTYIDPTASIVLSGHERRRIFINSINQANTVTLAIGQACEIKNVGSASLDVRRITGSTPSYTTTTITAGNSARFSWNNYTRVHSVTTGATTQSAEHAIESLATIRDWVISENDFIDCDNTLIDITGDFPNLQLIGNNAIGQCSPGEALVRLNGGAATAGVRVMKNDLPKNINANSIDIGSLNTADIKLRANVLDGYTSGSMGLTGTDAATIDADNDQYNWVD